MLAKHWKKILLFILIVACLFNIVLKLVEKVPYMVQLENSAKYKTEEQKVNEK